MTKAPPELASEALLSSKDKPLIATTRSTPGTAFATLVTFSMTRCVRSSDAPSGSCALTKK
jgi:hypothetical protein